MEVPEIRINLLCLLHVLMSDGVSIHIRYDHVRVQLKKTLHFPNLTSYNFLSI